MPTTTLPIVRHPDGSYWIEPTDAVADERIGPYATLAEARRDRAGVVRFLERQSKGLNPFE